VTIEDAPLCVPNSDVGAMISKDEAFALSQRIYIYMYIYICVRLSSAFHSDDDSDLNTAIDADDGNPVLHERARKARREWRDILSSIITGVERRDQARCRRKEVGDSDHLFPGRRIDDQPPGT